MAIPAADQDAALELLVDGYKTLRSKDPTHDLLKYLTWPDPEQRPEQFLYNAAHTDEFCDRFGGKKGSLTFLMASYAAALENAAGQVDDRVNGLYEMAEDVPFGDGDETD